jgi:membrane protease YdiL (CAAX protease family)
VLRFSPRSRDLFELLLGYGLILVVIWTPNPPQHILYWIAFIVVILITLLRAEDRTTLGLGTAGLLPSLWVVGAALALAAVAVWIAWRMHTLHPLFGNQPLGSHVWGYLLWAFLQQFLLQSYFLARLLRLVEARWLAVMLAAVIFSIAHIPNPLLIVLTLVWGLISCLIFLRYRNLYTLGLAHGILGICIAITVPNHIHRHMRVGLGYLHYHTHTWRAGRPNAAAHPTGYRP